MIYIYTPEIETGGPQTLHQLAYELVKNGLAVEMVYLSGNNYSKRKTALYYNELNVCNDDSMIDTYENIIIVPETLTYKLRQIRNAKRIICWLSLDYYKRTTLWNTSKSRLIYRGLPPFLTPAEIIYRLIFHRESCLPTLHTKNDFCNIFHFYNCEYVKRYLVNKGLDERNMAYLCGYIDESYFYEVDLSKKKRIITFNPAKIADKKFMEKFQNGVMETETNVEFVPIQNMTRDEVLEVLRKSMLYVDFGYFPGQERIPRQAVSVYNNILTSDLGSARNSIDIPIDSRFKIPLRESRIDYAVRLAVDMLDKYKEYLYISTEIRSLP